MKILQVTPYFAPAWAYGGPPRSVYELSRELVRRGHSVTVLTTDAHDEETRERQRGENIEGVEVHRFRNISNHLAWHQQLFLPMGVGAYLQRHLRNFDLVHLNMFQTLLNVVVHRFAVRDDIPFVLSARGTVSHIVRYRAAKALFDIAAGKRLLRDARKVIALSNAEKIQYESAGVPASKIAIVFNGIDSAAYHDLPSPGAFAEKYGLHGKRIIAYIGRLNARKGLDHLLRAFQRLSIEKEDVVLALVGPDDGYQARLERLAERLDLNHRVVFTGFMALHDKLHVLVDSDLIVYPGSHEPFGLVPFEALLCGKPVVVASGSGCSEIVEMSGAGYTVPFGNLALLQEAIAKGLDDGPDSKEMVSRGRKFVMEELNWNRIAMDMEGVYQEALST